MKPNVLHLINSFNQGGTERQTVQLVRLLHTRGHYRVHLACLDGSGPLRDEVEALGIGDIPEYRLKSFRHPSTAIQLRRFTRFLRQREIQVVHAYDFYTNIFGMTAAALERVPARIASKRETHRFRARGQKLLESCAYHFAHVIVSNSEAARAELISGGLLPEKTLTIYNGLDLDRVKPLIREGRDEILEIFNLPRGSTGRARPLVTIVANVERTVKDHPMFLRAARRVHDVVPDAAFVIAGEGGLMENLRGLAADLGIELDVFFLGRCERIAELLSVSSVCVLSSKAEGFSNAILEYMAAARPVVVTDVGGAREAVVEGETGYLVQSGDDEAMAARIISLLRNPVVSRGMGERGRRVVEEKFSCEALLERTQGLYDRLLAQTQSSRSLKVEGKRPEIA